MTRPIIDTSLSTMDMVTTILDNGETPKMKMVNGYKYRIILGMNNYLGDMVQKVLY